MKTPLTGSCQCGGITYSVATEPVFTYACHCYSCQKRTGSACSIGVVIAFDALTLSGELTAWSRVSEQGVGNTRYSCADCGNIIYGLGDNSPAIAKLQAGTLNDSSEVIPEVHIWTQSKQPWVQLPTAVKQYETQPDDLQELLHAALEYRAQ